MKRSAVVLSFLALVLTLGLGSPAVAAEIPAPLSFEQILGAQSVDQELAPVEAEPISLEELESLFGAEKVCGVLCDTGLPQRSCSYMCGNWEPAQCYRGRCVWS